MDKYFNSFREMISLRGLTDHTLQACAVIFPLDIAVIKCGVFLLKMPNGLPHHIPERE